MSPSAPHRSLALFAALFFILQTTSAIKSSSQTRRECSTRLAMQDTQPKLSTDSGFDAKTMFSKFSRVAVSAVCSVALSGFLGNVLPAHAESNGVVTVLGSNGKTGKMIVQYLSSQGEAVRPTSYRESSKNPFEGLAGVEAPTIGDVTKIETLEPALKGSKAVIFAASASNKGGKADKVDYEGVINVAKECVRLKVPRLVVISSGAVTRPDSMGYKITNLFGNIMEYKVKGEIGLKEAYANSDSSVSYVIIRPGGLLDSVAVGPGHIELNQGDSIAGEVNREDVAQAAAAAAISKTMPPKITFEMYEAGRSSPLEKRFAKITGYEQSGEKLGGDYNKLFSGLKSGDITIEAEKK